MSFENLAICHLPAPIVCLSPSYSVPDLQVVIYMTCLLSLQATYKPTYYNIVACRIALRFYILSFFPNSTC